MNSRRRKIHNQSLASVVLTFLLIPILVVTLSGQNGMLVVSSQPSLMGDTVKLDSIFRELSFTPTFMNRLPDRIDTHQYSLVVLAEFNQAECGMLPEFLREGGCIILTGGAPQQLFSLCDDSINVGEWIGFNSFLNYSGELVARIDLDQIQLSRDSLLDRTQCGIGFGGLENKNEGTEILAEWVCPGDSKRVAAITFNQYEKGKVFYFSRLLSALRVRDLLYWALDSGIEYRWGDADNSGQINITDAVFIVRLVFSGGNYPVFMNAGDCNADGSINISDAVYLLNYIFTGGPTPRAGRVE